MPRQQRSYNLAARGCAAGSWLPWRVSGRALSRVRGLRTVVTGIPKYVWVRCASPMAPWRGVSSRRRACARVPGLRASVPAQPAAEPACCWHCLVVWRRSDGRRAREREIFPTTRSGCATPQGAILLICDLRTCAANRGQETRPRTWFSYSPGSQSPDGPSADGPSSVSKHRAHLPHGQSSVQGAEATKGGRL